MTRWMLVAAMALSIAGCRSDRCESEPTSFQLDLSLPDPALANRADALWVRVRLAERSYSRRFVLGEELRDGQTAFAVDLDPAPTEVFEVTVEAEASAAGAPLARAEQTFRGSPDGCNRFPLALDRAPSSADGGDEDGSRADAAPVDLGLADAAAADAGAPDREPPPPEPPCAARAADDDVLLYTFDEVPAFTTTVADARGQHPAVARPLGAVVDRAPGPEGCGLAARFAEGRYLEVPSHPDFDLSAGALDFWVQATPTADRRLMEGILSRDASGTARSGHLSVYRACDGHLLVRLQRTNAPDVYRCSDGPLVGERWAHVGLNFGPPGVELYVDGELQTNTSSTTVRWDCGSPVPCGAPSSQGIDGNENPIVLGVSSHGSEEGSAAPVTRPFSGLIDSFRLSRNRRSF